MIIHEKSERISKWHKSWDIRGITTWILSDYQGASVSLTMPLSNKVYHFVIFPPFFEGLLPEGMMLEALLRKYKIDSKDYFAQLIIVGQDVVGAMTIEELK